ncbi:MAG: hypothetical protein B0W54_13430 [Cellvibrio sp. 79]|nr:MAG: hypothetical protein B0W54_13430 [Cellvibrio sp. 79]
MLKETITNLLEVSGSLTIARYITRKKPRILMYHRVIENTQLPGISPGLFEAQLRYIKKRFDIVSLNELLNNIDEKQKPYQLAITFDDGHRDFYTNAWPTLRKLDIPATIFVTTGFIDKKNWLWPDLLRSIVLAAKPDTYSHDGIGSFEITQSNPLIIWNHVADHCLTLSHEKREQFIISLAKKLGVPISSEPQDPYSPISWAELREMHAQGLDIGSHSVTHPILSDLDNEELLYELSYSRQRIREEIGIDPRGICYPNGMAKDTSPNVENHAQQFYQYGLVAYPATVSANHIMHLGRFAASSNMHRFKLLINGFSTHINQTGEYQ